jgi:hypothetical protein
MNVTNAMMFGEELADRHAAWCEATITAGQILQDLDGRLTLQRTDLGSHGDECLAAFFNDPRIILVDLD